MRINANGISFNVQIDGPESGPWVIFCNSVLTNLTMWEEQAADLKRSFRVMRYDQRGHGNTDVTDGKYSFDLLVADVVSLMDALSIQRAHFVGLSMGGITALFLAQRHAHRFDRVIACACGPASTPASAQQWNERIALGAEKGMAALADVTITRWFPPEFIATKAAVLGKLRGMILTTPFKGFAGCAAALSDYDLGPGLSRIDRPILLIVGTKDAALAGIRQIKAAIRGAALVELEGAGHISNVEQPAAFTRAIRDFLETPTGA
jgi:3-oxoadipate enol-lactonase